MQQPVLRHHDDLGKADKDHQHLPVIHCRDCHATGWGATLPKTSPNQLQQDLRLFYSAFFSEDVSTRFLFPATPTADRRVFERKQVCRKVRFFASDDSSEAALTAGTRRC
jgi:DEAD/DEAH box helicase domain-containing protein